LIFHYFSAIFIFAQCVWLLGNLDSNLRMGQPSIQKREAICQTEPKSRKAATRAVDAGLNRTKEM
jgi:hypothetical protein